MRALAIALTLIASPLLAGPDEDTAYIVEQTVNAHTYRAAFGPHRTSIIGPVMNSLQTSQIDLADPSAFEELVFEEFLSNFVQGMQVNTRAYYIGAFSPEHLAGIADFYRSDAGQAFLRQSQNLATFNTSKGQQIGQLAGENIKKRVANRLKDDGLIVTTDPTQMENLLHSLR